MLHHINSYSIWVILGFFGQALFGGRFLVQWIHSEKQRKSVIPMAFWWFSIGGGIILLIYSIHTKDPVFISGQLFGVIVYVRNIWLIFKERKAKTQEKEHEEAPSQ